MCFALALGLGLSLTSAGVSTAAPEAVAACPTEEGMRFKTPATGDRVHLVGPKGFLYYIPNSTIYFKLWGSWDGIVTADLSSCGKVPQPLNQTSWTNSMLAKTADSDAVYIWDETWPVDSYRHIVSWDVFTTKYHFDPAKIEERYAWEINPKLPDHPWT